MSDHGFAALGLSADVVRALSVRGIDTPFHVQSRTIPEALRGRDVLVKSPTGSGKTIAFAAPIVSGSSKAIAGRAPSCSCRRASSRSK